MTNENDAWQHYMQRHASIRDAHTPTILQRHQTADDQTHLMLNALLLLNGGGLAAIPALKARYDTRRRVVLPQHGIRLVELDYSMFDHDGRKRLRRDRAIDEAVIRSALRSH